jgi:hypothetical protein
MPRNIIRIPKSGADFLTIGEKIIEMKGKVPKHVTKLVN